MEPFNNFDLLVPTIDKAEIQNFNFENINNFCHQLLEDPMVAYNKVNIVVTGYDDDMRDLWEIDEVRNYFQFMDRSFPYFFFFFNRDIPSKFSPFILLFACLLPINNSERNGTVKSIEFDLSKSPIFFETHFGYMNELFDKCKFEEKENIKASDEIMQIYSAIRPA